jgi:cytochrome c oxidase subunit 4
MPAHASHPRTYLLVYAALICLTVLTVGLDLLERDKIVDVGRAQHPLALTIAAAKAVLVILFFMHLWRSSRLTWAVALCSLFWLAILLVYTLTDYLSRTWTHVPGH